MWIGAGFSGATDRELAKLSPADRRVECGYSLAAAGMRRGALEALLTTFSAQ